MSEEEQISDDDPELQTIFQFIMVVINQGVPFPDVDIPIIIEECKRILIDTRKHGFIITKKGE